MHRSRSPILLFALLFSACILGSWAWFNLDFGPRRSTLDPGRPAGIWLTARTNIEGYVFVSEPVSESVKKTLGTTNILSGTFVRKDSRVSSDESRALIQAPKRTSEGQSLTTAAALGARRSTRPMALDAGRSTIDPASRVTVFLASWPADNNKGLEAIRHTPDICWGGTGWKPVALGQPQQIIIELPVAKGHRLEVSNQKSEVPPSHTLTLERFQSPADLPPTDAPTTVPTLDAITLSFSCRAFESPDSKTIEVVAWCALLSYDMFIDPRKNQSDQIQELKPNLRSYRERASEFLSVLRCRLRIRAEKQFARFSAPLTHGFETAMESLSSFSKLWISAVGGSNP